MARHIEQSAKKEGRYKGRERDVAWATVHKEMPKSESHLRGQALGDPEAGVLAVAERR